MYWMLREDREHSEANGLQQDHLNKRIPILHHDAHADVCHAISSSPILPWYE